MSGALMAPQGGFLGVTSDLSAAGAAALTATFIGFGDAANELTDDANLTWINGTGVVGINRVAGQTADADFLQYDGLVTDEAVQAGIRWTVDGSEASVRAEWTGVTGNVADGFQLRYTAPDHFFQSTNAAVTSTAIHVVTAASEYVMGLTGGVNQFLIPTDSGVLTEVDIAKIDDVNTGLLWSAADTLQTVTAGTPIATMDGNFTVNKGQLLVPVSVQALPGLAIDGDPTTGLFGDGASVLQSITAGVARIQVSSSGLRIFTTGIRNVDGLVGTPSYTYDSDKNTGDFQVGDDEIGRVTAGLLRMAWDASGSVVMGTGALATAATDGYFYGTTCAGVPTGVPTAKTGRTPQQYDSTNKDLYVFDVGDAAWQKVGPSFDSISKNFIHSDLTEAVNNVNEAVAFDDAIPAGAVITSVEVDTDIAFSGNGLTSLDVSVINSNLAPTVISGVPTARVVIGPVGATSYAGAFGNILAGDTPDAIFNPDSSHSCADATAGSTTITIHFYVP